MKAATCATSPTRSCRRQLCRGQGRAVQPAIPAGHQPAGQHGAAPPGAPEVARIATVMREQEIEAWERLQEE